MFNLGLPHRPRSREKRSGSYEVHMELKYKWRVFNNLQKLFIKQAKKFPFKPAQFYKEQNPYDGDKHSILLLHNIQVL